MDKTGNNESIKDAKEPVGIKRLEEIYELVAVKAIVGLQTETTPSDNTCKMIALSQDLYNQMNINGSYLRVPNYGYFGGGCT